MDSPSEWCDGAWWGWKCKVSQLVSLYQTVWTWHPKKGYKRFQLFSQKKNWELNHSVLTWAPKNTWTLSQAVFNYYVDIAIHCLQVISYDSWFGVDLKINPKVHAQTWWCRLDSHHRQQRSTSWCEQGGDLPSAPFKVQFGGAIWIPFNGHYQDCSLYGGFFLPDHVLKKAVVSPARVSRKTPFQWASMRGLNLSAVPSSLVQDW